MPKICYLAHQFRAESLQLIKTANEIIGAYAALRLWLSLRQLYYRMVARNVFENTYRNYKNFGEIIKDARNAGLIDWNAIEDRTRNVRSFSHWTDPGDIIRSAAGSYRIDLWKGQHFYIEAWIEKDALVDVIGTVCQEYDVPYFSARGYNSTSEAWRAAQRIAGKLLDHDEAVILHLGDHDPSGVDMTRDIAERLKLYGKAAPIEVRRIALLREQVDDLALPPNPAKVRDSRYADYAAKHGDQSWELDALEPTYLLDLVRTELESHIDGKLLDARRQDQEKGQKLLMATADHWPELAPLIPTNGRRPRPPLAGKGRK